MEVGADRTTILGVQGDPEARRQLAEMVRAAAMEVVEASSVDEALAGVKRRPDLVILAALPDADVHALCARLKREPEMEGIPVLYRGPVPALEEVRARGLGDLYEGYVRDPIDPAELVTQQRALVRLGRTERRLARTLAKQRFGAAVLAEMNEALAAPMRLRETLSTAATLLTPQLADAVAVAVLRRDG